jgi:hypothetical protein
MALTLVTTNYTLRDRWNDALVRRARLTGPASYATGGIAIDNDGDFGWGETHTLQGTIWDGTTLYTLHLDFTNQKVVVVDTAAGTEIGNGTNLSAFYGQIVATGR